MTLKAIALDRTSAPTPRKVTEYLAAVDHLVELHRVDSPLTLRGFIPSDYHLVYSCLRTLSESNLLCGDRFCEWGSGVGVVASLAAMLGFDSYGIERDGVLCAVAERSRLDFAVRVHLFHGSYVPDGVEDLIDDAFIRQDGELSLDLDCDQAYDELGHTIDEFDLIFAYPWPNDVDLTMAIFDRCAAQGALLLVYLADTSIALYRKL